MLDRVREALFSTLQHAIPDALVLDLFAGSGSLGLEALSRGARHVRFVEQAPRALAQLRGNVEGLGIRERVEIVVGDGWSPSTWGPAADVAFVDPPYAMLDAMRPRVLGALERLVATHVAPDATVVLHTPHGALATADVPFAEARVRRYGTNDLWYLRRRAA